ncbi:MAG: hypothetical protein ACOVP1_11610 [Bacteroidia bacterium]
MIPIVQAQEQPITSVPTANRSGLFFNGLRLNAGEKVYTNTFLFVNSMGFGIHKNFELHAGLVIIPLVGESSSGALPLITVLPRIGYDFGNYHHVSAGVLINTGVKSTFLNQQIAYSFGSRRNNIGILYSSNEMFMENERTWYLQYHFFPFKRISLGAEHLLWSSYKKQNSLLPYHATNNHDPLLPSNFVGRIHFSPNFVLALGYFSDYASFSQDGILYLSASLRINKKKSS